MRNFILEILKDMDSTSFTDDWLNILFVFVAVLYIMYYRNLSISSKIYWQKIAQYWRVCLLVKNLLGIFQADHRQSHRLYLTGLSGEYFPLHTRLGAQPERSCTQVLSPHAGRALSTVSLISPRTSLLGLYLSPWEEVILCGAFLNRGIKGKTWKTFLFFLTWNLVLCIFHF